MNFVIGNNDENPLDNNTKNIDYRQIIGIIIVVGVIIYLIILFFRSKKKTPSPIIKSPTIIITLKGDSRVTYSIEYLDGRIIKPEANAHNDWTNISFNITEPSFIINRTDDIGDAELTIQSIMKDNIQLPQDSTKSVIRGDLHPFSTHTEENRKVRQEDIMRGNLKWGERKYQIDII